MTSLITTGAVGLAGARSTSGLTYYCERVSGFLTPPLSANFTFYVGSDDASDLYLSPDEYAANATLAAYSSLSVPMDYVYWRRGVNGRTPARPLRTGRRYYFTSRHAQGYGSDFVFAGVSPNSDAPHQRDCTSPVLPPFFKLPTSSSSLSLTCSRVPSLTCASACF